MATGQSILDLMEVINAELQLQSGEADVARGLRALNAAQDAFEARLARFKEVRGDTTGTVQTSASTESTAFPTGVLRIDRLQYIDPDTSRPAWDLAPLRGSGSHAASNYWPMSLHYSSGSGKPHAYWTNGRSIYWDPLPSGTHTIRWYGLQAVSDITAGGTFAYEDMVMLPLASFANRLLKEGWDDNVQAAEKLAESLFDPVIGSMINFQRDGAQPLSYSFIHET